MERVMQRYPPRQTVALTLIALVLVFAVACQDAGQNVTDVDAPESTVAQGLMRLSASGQPISEDQMAAIHTRLIRDVAMALADADLRALVHGAIHESTI